MFLGTISFAALNYLTSKYQLPQEDVFVANPGINDVRGTLLKERGSPDPPALTNVLWHHKKNITAKISYSVGLLDEEEIPVPAVITPIQYDVKCSRKFYCNPASCQPVYIKGYTKHSYIDIEQKFFRSNDNSNQTINIQYWGDSTSATMECDMRQWIHEIESTNNTSANFTAATITTNYRMIGCPWWNCTPDVNWGGLPWFAENADVIIFNIGAHYELGKNDESLIFEKRASAFDIDMDRYYAVLQQVLAMEGKMVLIRGPSPTHFDTEDGIIEENMLSEMWKGEYEYSCVPLRKIPAVIQRQEHGLKFLTDRLKHSNKTATSSTVDYLDVYELTRGRHMEHTDNGMKLDCKHYCQNCGILRAWNALLVDYIISR